MLKQRQLKSPRRFARPQPERRRHLLRLWLSASDGWELPPVFAERYGSVKRGTVRGGIEVPGAVRCCPLEADGAKLA